METIEMENGKLKTTLEKFLLEQNTVKTRSKMAKKIKKIFEEEHQTLYSVEDITTYSIIESTGVLFRITDLTAGKISMLKYDNKEEIFKYIW